MNLLFGIVIAAFIFAALLWSLYRAVSGVGMVRVTHAAVVVLIIALMAALTLGWSIPARGLGAVLIIAGLGAVWNDTSWSRLLPMCAAGFGLAALQGLPLGAP